MAVKACEPETSKASTLLDVAGAVPKAWFGSTLAAGTFPTISVSPFHTVLSSKSGRFVPEPKAGPTGWREEGRKGEDEPRGLGWGAGEASDITPDNARARRARSKPRGAGLTGKQLEIPANHSRDHTLTCMLGDAGSRSIAVRWELTGMSGSGSGLELGSHGEGKGLRERRGGSPSTPSSPSTPHRQAGKGGTIGDGPHSGAIVT